MPKALLTIPAGEYFAEAKKGYLRILDNEQAAYALRERAVEMIAEAQVTAAALPDRIEADTLIANAQGKLVEIDVLLRQISLDRLTTLMRTVNSIGSTIGRLRITRAKVSLVDPADFDTRFANLERRYNEIYRPMFPVGAGGIIEVPDPLTMTAEAWETIHTHVEGPIFLWDIVQCRENWVVPGVPDCKGPDYLDVLSMINQVMEMWLTEIDLRGEFPMISFYDDILNGFVKRVAGMLVEVENIINNVGRTLKSLSELAANVTGAIADVTAAVAKSPGWLMLAVVGGGIYLLTRKNRKRGRES